ncbi:TapB family protein [Hyalangium versicolor]|uniref:TapB family protein n=1 Tax=Hyalangium versicolor TaxID=2861190 RepID=UPI001CCE12BA|nr:hypothetical protein [Hyalangium versicolor]
MPSAGAPCPNPYFPLEDGLKLTYRAGSSELLISTREVTPTPEGQKGLLAVDLKGRSGQTEAFCTSEGVRTGLGGLEGTLLSASGMQVEVVAAEGVAVPAPANMVPGASWRNSLSVKMQPPAGSKMPAGMVFASTFDKEATVVGEEEVTVGAGTFKALKVKNMTTARAHRSGSPGRSIESYIWFAPGVGIVKVATGGNTDLELLKVERPATATTEPATVKKKGSKKL